jgi:tetratricopeptide (TPR) repeat protein
VGKAVPVPGRGLRRKAKGDVRGLPPKAKHNSEESKNPMNRGKQINPVKPGGALSRASRTLAVFAILAALAFSVGCNKLKARDQLNKGVQSYKNARYEDAIEHFKNSVNLDPSLLNARLYLATAYAQQYIPGADTPDNNKFAEQAIEEFKKVLDQNPNRDAKVGSLKGIASLYYNMKKFDQAKEYNQKVIEVDPNDPEVYYSIGVIDWATTYPVRQEERAKLGMKPTDNLSDKKVCAMLKAKNWDTALEGIKMLQKALELRPDYDDAMAYLNLMYREKADIECDDPDQRTADLKTADEWVDKTLATKKAKAEKKGPGGIVAEPAPQ